MIYKKDLLERIEKLEERSRDTSGWEISKEIARALNMRWEKVAVKKCTIGCGEKAVLEWKLVKIKKNI